jgi:hypothetical protein
MAKTSWVIMKEYDHPSFISPPAVHMIGFRSKREAENECDRLNKKALSLVYSLCCVKVFQPQEDS